MGCTSRSIARLFSAGLFLGLCAALVPGANGQDLGPADRFERWREEVEPIMLRPEMAAFDRLTADYQRQAFIREFWRVRDPFPQTARNEMKERYEERVAHARSNFNGLDDDRTRVLLVHGFPNREVEVRCTTTRSPAVIWAYSGSDAVDFGFVVVFLRGSGGTGPARIWRPGRGGVLEQVIRSARACINGSLLDDLAKQIRGLGSDYESRIDRVLLKPRPRSLEWVSAFSAASTDLPADSTTFDSSVLVDYLGRHQSRTAVRGVVSFARDEADIGEFAGHRSFDFVLLGEVVREDELLESFRYQFGIPAEAARPELNLVFQRYLRPDEYRVILRIEDLHGQRFSRVELPLVVPQLDQEFVPPSTTDPEIDRIFAEATAALELGETTLALLPPSEGLQTGFLRTDTLATGDNIDRVRFFLDDELILTKNRPPYNVELDLGPFPRRRLLRAEALDDTGQTLAWDELELNAGGQRFSVRLVSPRAGESFADSVLVEARVNAPEDKAIDFVEVFLNETLMAKLYQEPWIQPLALDQPGQLSYVRVVAHLTDGNKAEDLVFVNAPDHLEEVEIQFVELYAAVTDRNGRLIEGLDVADFAVREDGSAQRITRFEKVEDLPIHVGVLIDNSASMKGAIDTARRAALGFFEEAITPRDRAAVITFNRFPNLAVRLTSDLSRLGGGLAGLTAEGQTALYDSLMFALYHFTGVSGQRAILLLSDGKDEVSRFSFEDTLEYARRAGVTVYAVGLQIGETGAKRKLATLARETGGESYFIQDPSELAGIYAAIQRELRSQYLIAYQSTNTAANDRFRRVEVKVGRPGARVKTISGYYP